MPFPPPPPPPLGKVFVEWPCALLSSSAEGPRGMCCKKQQHKLMSVSESVSISLFTDTEDAFFE